MQPNSRFCSLIPTAGIGAALAALLIACSSDNEPPVEPTAEPRYNCVEVIPTPLEEDLLPTIENLPIPTPEAQPTVTASGVQVFDVQVGSGEAAQAGGIVYVNYKLWVEGGHQCDANTVAPVRYRLVEGQVVNGLIEGIAGMQVGGKRIIVVPPELGYGAIGSGNVIPPDATLIYQIELTDVSNPAQ